MPDNDTKRLPAAADIRQRCHKCGGSKDLSITFGGIAPRTESAPRIECANCLNAALPAQTAGFSLRYATRSEMIHSEAQSLMDRLNSKDSPLTDHEHELARALTEYFLRYRIEVANAE